MTEPEWLKTMNKSCWKPKDVFVMFGYSLIPLYGTWIAICSLRTWTLKNEELKEELRTHKFFFFYHKLFFQQG